MSAIAKGMRQTLPRVSPVAVKMFFPPEKHSETQVHQRTLFSTSISTRLDEKLDPAKFYQSCRESGINFFCGVPDSLLKDFCAYVTSHSSSKDHVITANEGAAVGLASGYHLATGQPAMVYLQNSGVGNMVNPLMSLADPDVYSIPMLILIGWRGEPGVKDEPQHVSQGRITPDIVECMGLPWDELPRDEAGMKEVLKKVTSHFESHKSPYCLLVRKSTFDTYKLQADDAESYPLSREDALVQVIDCLEETDAVVGTTGMLSRELFECRVSKEMGHGRDFLTVGSMGHASAIALGVAMHTPNKQVFCLDGDGSTLMHMGSMATVGQQGPANIKHVIFNNGAHDSVGGQPTEAANHDKFDLQKIATGCGYRETLVASTKSEIEAAVRQLHQSEGPVLLEVKCRKGSRANLGRPTRTTHENKHDFMDFLQE